jgi:hypothetical protein
MTFRIALIKQSYHGVYSFIKYVARTYLPQAIANAIDGIKPYFKEWNLLK